MHEHAISNLRDGSEVVFRKSFVDIDGIKQPAPAPRFSRTVPEIKGPPPECGEHSESALADWGLPTETIKSLKNSGAI